MLGVCVVDNPLLSVVVGVPVIEDVLEDVGVPLRDPVADLLGV